MSAEEGGLLYVVGPDGEVHEGLSVEQAVALAVEQALGTDAVPADARCRICGCTNEQSCSGGCQWVQDPEQRGALCSACYVRGWRMTEERQLALIRELVELSRDPATPAAPFAARPYEAFVLVSAIQVCLRHPGLGAHMAEVLRGFGRQVQALFAGDTWFLLEQGWHRDLDVPVPPPDAETSRG